MADDIKKRLIDFLNEGMRGLTESELQDRFESEQSAYFEVLLQLQIVELITPITAECRLKDATTDSHEFVINITTLSDRAIAMNDTQFKTAFKKAANRVWSEELEEDCDSEAIETLTSFSREFNKKGFPLEIFITKKRGQYSFIMKACWIEPVS